MTFIGVDPGKKGSLALLENGAVSIFPFDEDTYIEMLGKVAPHASICCLEHVGSMPGQANRGGCASGNRRLCAAKEADGGDRPQRHHYRRDATE